MKSFGLFLICVVSILAPAQSEIYSTVSKQYLLAVNDRKIALKNAALLTQDVVKNKAILMAYKGAYTIVLARSEKSLSVKTKMINEGKKWIEDAVSFEPKNVEIRFVRFTIQKNLPSILGYNKNINSDKDFVLKNIESLKNEEQKKQILQYLRTAQ